MGEDESVYISVIEEIDDGGFGSSLYRKILSYEDATKNRGSTPRTEADDDLSLRIWLASRGLARIYAQVREMGAKKVSDLAHLTVEDFEVLGLSLHETQALAVVIT